MVAISSLVFYFFLGGGFGPLPWFTMLNCMAGYCGDHELCLVCCEFPLLLFYPGFNPCKHWSVIVNYLSICKQLIIMTCCLPLKASVLRAKLAGWPSNMDTRDLSQTSLWFWLVSFLSSVMIIILTYPFCLIGWCGSFRWVRGFRFVVIQFHVTLCLNFVHVYFIFLWGWKKIYTCPCIWLTAEYLCTTDWSCVRWTQCCTRCNHKAYESQTIPR